MDKFFRAKSISIWIFIVPFIAVNACLLITTQFHLFTEMYYGSNASEQYKLGNISEGNLADFVDAPLQQKFGADKFATLPKYCKDCEYLQQCYGECPKHRCASTPDGEPGLNMLCAGYKQFFQHSRPLLLDILRRLRYGLPPESVMQDIARYENKPAKKQKIGPNAPCPCGSGKKYKRCCGRWRR